MFLMTVASLKSLALRILTCLLITKDRIGLRGHTWEIFWVSSHPQVNGEAGRQRQKKSDFLEG